MIQKFVDRFNANSSSLREKFAAKHPENYKEIVSFVVEAISDTSECDESPDWSQVTMLDHGDYQGTLLFIMPKVGYQPSTYYYVFVSYGSCSGCDTLEAIRDYQDGLPAEQQVNDYMTLALHIVQGIKKIFAYDWETE